MNVMEKRYLVVVDDESTKAYEIVSSNFDLTASRPVDSEFFIPGLIDITFTTHSNLARIEFDEETEKRLAKYSLDNHGEWVKGNYDPLMESVKCSACGEPFITQDGEGWRYEPTKYCGNCGVRMDVT